MNVLNWDKISKVFSNILIVCTFRCYIIHIIREGQMSKCGGPVTNHFTQICGTKRDYMVQGKSTLPTIQFRLTTCNLCFSETIWWDRKVTRDAYKKSNSVENSFHRRGAFWRHLEELLWSLERNRNLEFAFQLSRRMRLLVVCWNVNYVSSWENFFIFPSLCWYYRHWTGDV